MKLRKIFVLLPFIIYFNFLQGCSKSSEQAQDSSKDEFEEFKKKDQQPLELKTLGPLINDDAGILSLKKTGLKWKNTKDQVSQKEFYQDAYRKGCFQAGQPQELLQIDPDLRAGQKFKMTFKDSGQGYELLTVKRRSILEINRAHTELVYSSEFLDAKDSRIANYQGPLVTQNPFEKMKLKLGQSRLTQRPLTDLQILETKLHPELVKNLEGANGSMKVDCHLENNLNGAEVLALGQIRMKSGQTVKANKKTILNAGMVVCERVDYSPYSNKNELEKFRGQSHRMGPGKYINVIISSNELPSPIFHFCGGTRLLDLKLLVLDDGRVLQQRMDLVDEITEN